MIIDCDECAMQHTVVCDDCVVTFILSEDGEPEGSEFELNSDEEVAVLNLASAGLVPRLKLVPRTEEARQRVVTWRHGHGEAR